MNHPSLVGLVKGGIACVGAVSVLELCSQKQSFSLGRFGASFTLGIIYAISGLGTGVWALLMRRWFG